MSSSVFYGNNSFSQGATFTADTYLNWGSTVGTSGYGLRDNAGTIEFKGSGGSWAPIAASAGSAGGWTKTGAVVALTTGTDTIGSNLRPTDVTYTLGDATHGWLSAFLHTNVDGAGTQGLFLQDGAGPAAVLYPYANGDVEFDLLGTAGFYITADLLDLTGDLLVESDATVTGLLTAGRLDAELAGPGTAILGQTAITADTAAAVNGVQGSVVASGTSSSTVEGYTALSGVIHLLNTAHADNVFGNYITFNKDAGASAGLAVSYWASDLAPFAATNPYYFWGDSRGVYRIREDNVADGSGNPQAVPALYNPRFTKYTPGATNYERIIEQWVGNVGVLGIEAGGTGTLRKMQMVGAGLILSTDILPTADPHVVGQLWNSSTTLKVSAG
jgi:hypothetical protein